MTIDWLTVGAQALNFLVLVYLLKRFLYGPIVRAMARREQTIAERLRDAEQQKAGAEAEARQHREARERLEAERGDLIERAREEAAELRQKLEEELRHEVEALRERWRADVAREEDAFLRDVRRHATEQFEALARRALADLASADLEAQIAQVLVGRLRDLRDEARTALVHAVDAGERLRIRSVFELSGPLKASIRSALHEALGRDVDVAFERSADLVCGLEIRAGGCSLAWSLNGYLDRLERRLADGLGARETAREGPPAR
jgi:F-type H+-transporting ATPase subunit b